MMLGKADRKITVIDRGESVVVVDARSGAQEVHRLPKRQAARLLVVTKQDTIVVDAKTLAVSIEPLMIVREQPTRHERAARPAKETKPQESQPKVRRVCKHLGPELVGEKFPPSEGLGDLVSHALSAIGVTKERWAWLKSKFREDHPDDCTGCTARHVDWNAWGQKHGLPAGQGPELQKILATELIQPQTARLCAVHGKCLTSMRGSDELRTASEAAGFSWCNGCNERELVRIDV